MTQQLLLVGGVIAIFASIVGLVMALGATASDRQQVNRSLAALEALGPRRDEVRRELDRPFVERVLGPIVQRLSRLGGQLSPRDEASKLRHRIDLAGNPAGWDVERILAFKVIGLVCGVVVGIALPLALSGGLAVDRRRDGRARPARLLHARPRALSSRRTTAASGSAATCLTRWTC